MEDKLDNAGVEAKQLPKEFLDAVKVWDIENMIAMMAKGHQLMLTPCNWGVRQDDNNFPAVCTIFQLAVLLNSDKMVGEMLRIFICEVRFSLRQLIRDLFEQRFQVYGNEISAWDAARVSGNKCILGLFKKASEGNPIDFEKTAYFAGIKEKQDVCDRLHPMLYGKFQEVFKDNSAAKQWWFHERLEGGGSGMQSLLRSMPTEGTERRSIATEGTVREISFDASLWIDRPYDARWWGAPYGISLPRDEDDLFVLHWIAGNVCWLFHGFFEIICETLGNNHIISLLQLTDHNGQTPLHILATTKIRDFAQVAAADSAKVKSFLHMAMKVCGSDFNVNGFIIEYSLDGMRDLAGRTSLQHAVGCNNPNFIETMATIDNVGLKRSARNISHDGATALQLAVKHNNYACVKMLLDHSSNINLCSDLKVILRGPDGTKSSLQVPMGAFQIAALAAHIRILKVLLEQPELSDESLINLNTDVWPNKIPALHLAAIGGNPLSVTTLLESGKINPFTIDRRYGTALHFAAGWELEDLDMRCASDFVTVRNYSDYMASTTPDANRMGNSLGGKTGSMDMLMQAGLDMEQEDRDGQTPQLISSASDELSRWWYDKFVQQNQEAKANLVAAANAVSVTAALVATASFLGPLTPPLGYSQSTDAWLTGYSQVNHTAVQAFLFCNSLSFYFAIAAIMLGVIPSFTIPQEGLRLEVRIANRVVQVAVLLLFLSITFVICAFSAATIGVAPESRWHYKVLAVVSTILGSLVCLIALCLFLLRLTKLIKPNVVWVTTLTNSVFFPSKKQRRPSKKQSRPGHSDTADRDTIAKWVTSLKKWARMLKKSVFFPSKKQMQNDSDREEVVDDSD